MLNYLLVDYSSPLYTHCDAVLPTLYRNLNHLEMCGVDCDFVFFIRKLTSLRFSKKTKVTSTYELISCGNCHEMFNCNLLCIEITQKMYTCYMSLKILQIKVLEFCNVKLDRCQSLKRFLNSIKYLTLLKFNTETQTIRWLYLLHTKRLCLSTLFNMMLEPIIDTRHH